MGRWGSASLLPVPTGIKNVKSRPEICLIYENHKFPPENARFSFLIWIKG
jgi:hypothetical protein